MAQRLAGLPATGRGASQLWFPLRNNNKPNLGSRVLLLPRPSNQSANNLNNNDNSNSNGQRGQSTSIPRCRSRRFLGGQRRPRASLCAPLRRDRARGQGGQSRGASVTARPPGEGRGGFLVSFPARPPRPASDTLATTITDGWGQRGERDPGARIPGISWVNAAETDPRDLPGLP